MSSTLPILRSRRERRLARQRRRAAGVRGAVLSTGMLVSLVLSAALLAAALAYAEITQGLPPVDVLPHLLNPPGGLLLQPTRIVDRTGQHLLRTFAPDDSPRRYIPLSQQNPQHIPAHLVEAVLTVQDPAFWTHPGYSLRALQDPQVHPTLAQQLAADLLLYDEPPSLRRAVRERILAAQITADYGRTQVLEWYLNSANFGNQAYGVEAAARLYFGKSAVELTLAESAMLAAAGGSPALNPIDSPQVALQLGREVLHVLHGLGMIDDAQAVAALAEAPVIQPAPPPRPRSAAAFTNLVLAQLETQLPRERIERGGLTIFSTLDYDLQAQASCVTEVYAARLAGLPEPDLQGCEAARLLPSLPPGITFRDSSASALILDPKAGQVLALVGETVDGVETPLSTAHRPGSVLDAFVYLTAFTRGLSPASLTWDIPGLGAAQNFDGEYHGPMRLRTALANDYQVPAEALTAQMGIGRVREIADSFGVDPLGEVHMLELAGAYGVLGTQGAYFGRELPGGISPVGVLRLESSDGSLLMDWGTPEARSIVTPALAYLMTHVLGDEPARWPTFGQSNPLEIGRPAGVKVGQTGDGKDAWVVGYTPARVVVAWTDVRGEGQSLTPRFPAVLWNALMQLASRGLPADGWSAPAGVVEMTVCDPSGQLPSPECPNLVTEVFLNGNEPIQADTLYREFSINRETGLLATVFTPVELIEQRVFLRVPEEARAWAQGAGLPVPPTSYDAIQAPPLDPLVNISAPGLFTEVSGVVPIVGTASGEDFAYYRVQVGRGLNPQEWIQLGGDVITPVEAGVLAEWDTRGLGGLYAVQLQVVRSDQRVDSAVIQVTVAE